VYGRALEAIRANPEKYYAVLERKKTDDAGRMEKTVS
jgi:hypothetical protein